MDKIVIELQRIVKQKGYIKPQDVVDEARNPDNCLHNCFEWDDEIAGDKYRLHQARTLLKTIKIEIEGQEVRAFFNAKVLIDDKQDQAYFTVKNVLENENLYKSVLIEAIKDIRGIQREYGHLKEIKEMLNEEKINYFSEKLNI